MRRREFITLLGGAAAAWPLAARAQAAKKIPRLCFLTFDPGRHGRHDLTRSSRACVDLGYVDGQTITIDYFPRTVTASDSELSLPNVSPQGGHHRR